VGDAAVGSCENFLGLVLFEVAVSSQQQQRAPSAARATESNGNVAQRGSYAGLGNAFQAELIGRKGAKGVTNDIPGHSDVTDFGSFWVVPDDTDVCYAGVQGEQITESEFAALKKTWDAITAGTGSIVISETDEAGNAHAGFRAKVLDYLGKLMSAANGRTLVTSMVNSSHKLTIQPSNGQLLGGGAASTTTDGLVGTDGKKGSGADATIELDPDLNDDTVVVNDKDGNEISDPAYIVLGHEMIHAQHDAEGTNQKHFAPTDASYGDLEEEQTIATGDMSENALRDDAGLPHRSGHGGRDTR